MIDARIALLLLVACSSASSPHIAHRTSATAPPCLADDIKTLRWQMPDPACTESGTCAKDCEDGVANGCFLEAQAWEAKSDRDRAARYYARTCKLGMSLGCTNWGANVWISSKTPSKEVCAKRVFEAACRARDPWACGMHGRFLAVAARTDDERAAARAYFDGSCNDIGDVTCRMFGLHLEADQLGAWTPVMVKALLIRACETGDGFACGAETASETFE